jgi:thiol-disulfide isomerase/thioredoxin
MRRPLRPPNPRRTCLQGLACGLAALAAGPWVAPAAAAGGAAAGPQPQPWPRGRTTPPLALPAWEGPEWTLAGARGQVVVLNFWASWCEPCRAEMPSLELLATRFENQGLQVQAVNHRETDGAVRRFIEQSGCTLPILRDRDGAAARAWGVRIFPSTIVIGRTGRAAFTVVGEADWMSPQAHQWLAPLLPSPPSPRSSPR